MSLSRIQFCLRSPCQIQFWAGLVEPLVFWICKWMSESEYLDESLWAEIIYNCVVAYIAKCSKVRSLSLLVWKASLWVNNGMHVKSSTSLVFFGGMRSLEVMRVIKDSRSGYVSSSCMPPGNERRLALDSWPHTYDLCVCVVIANMYWLLTGSFF